VFAADEAISDVEAAALFADLTSTRSIILAVSGGPDSTALLLLAARWRSSLRGGPRLTAVTVDHGLRAQSANEAAAVKRLARSLKVAHRTVRWTGAKPVTGIQEAARSARYRLLAAEARKAGARHILTAHTRDDQAETVLLRLSRGSGLAGLSGMARMSLLPASRTSDRVVASAGRGARGHARNTARMRHAPHSQERAGELLLVRPFLDLPKTQLVATLQRSDIAFADDASNRDPRFARPRLRTLMPMLAAEGLSAARLAQFARRTARADAAIEAAVAAAQVTLALTQWSKSGPIIFAASEFDALPEEVALRLLGRAIGSRGDEGPVELGKLETLFEALTEFCREPADAARFRRTLAGALVTMEDEQLVVERAPARRQKR
jgi:tRNA(Ile)-lysidine synthase